MEGAGGVRQHLEHVALAGRLGPGLRIGNLEGARVGPDLLPFCLDCRCVVPIHHSALAVREQKSLSIERPLEVVAAWPRSPPSLCKQALHSPPSLASASVAVMGVLELLPDSVAVEDGELVLGGMRVSALASEFGTPLVAYCEETLRARARAYREAAPDAVTLYGSKAFPNAALVAPVLRGGARRRRVDAGRARARASCGRPAKRIVVHGNNKSDDELRRAAEADVWLVVLDAEDEVERAAAAGLRRVLVRVTPGIAPDTHDAIKTGHRGSKFGLPPEQALDAIARARRSALTSRACTCTSALSSSTSRRRGSRSTGSPASRPSAARSSTGHRRSSTRAAGSASDTSETDAAPTIRDFAGTSSTASSGRGRCTDCPVPRLVFEPGRSLVGEAG